MTAMQQFEDHVFAAFFAMRPKPEIKDLHEWARAIRHLIGVSFLCGADAHETALWIHALITGRCDRIVCNVRD